MKHPITVFTLLVFSLLAIGSVSASHDTCDHHDCPLWVQSGVYDHPISSSSSSSFENTRYHHNYRPARYGYPPVSYYEFIDVHHPPRTWYVHYNDNYYQPRSSHVTTRNRYRGYSASSSVYRGGHFSVYY